MIQCWQCEVCGKTFPIKEMCLRHEESHYPYLDYKQIAYLIAQKNKNREICDFCKNAYYIYGCELNCSFMKECLKNGYNKFIPNNNLLEKINERTKDS